MMMDTLIAEQHKPGMKVLVISARQRATLLKLLEGDSRRCSAAAIAALQRRGWVSGPEQGYQLTAPGRRIAEMCEAIAGEGELELEIPFSESAKFLG